MSIASGTSGVSLTKTSGRVRLRQRSLRHARRSQKAASHFRLRPHSILYHTLTTPFLAVSQPLSVSQWPLLRFPRPPPSKAIPNTFVSSVKSWYAINTHIYHGNIHSMFFPGGTPARGEDQSQRSDCFEGSHHFAIPRNLTRQPMSTPGYQRSNWVPLHGISIPYL
jgi:hypothetical protein